MRQSRDELHLDGVPVLHWVVQDTRSVHHLPAEILAVSVSYIQRLGGEGVWLDLHVSSGDLVYEARLANVRDSCDQQSPFVGVDGGKTI